MPASRHTQPRPLSSAASSRSKAELKLGWFSSGGGEGSRGLLNSTLGAISAGFLNARLEFVFCNRERGQRAATDVFLDLVEEHGIPLVTFSSYRFRRRHGNAPWAELREAYDEAAIDLLGGLSPTVSVGAGYMLIAPLLCERYRMINLHPALPGGPIGTWQNVIWELMERRATESGVMVNRMTREVDAGPVLTFCRYPLAGGRLDPMWSRIRDRSVEDLKANEGEANPLFRAIRKLGLRYERPMLVATLAAIAGGEIDPASPPASAPLDLTTQVEAAIANAAEPAR